MPRQLTQSQRSRIERYSRAGLEQWQAERRTLIIELRAAGWTWRAIAETLGMGHPRVIEIANEGDAA